MSMARRILIACISTVGLLLSGACTDVDTQPAPASSMDDYWSTCPDMPVWNRNLDLFEQVWPDEDGYPTPSDAVHAVTKDSVEIEYVTEERKLAQVQVRDGDDVGTFAVRQLVEGWVVESGEGCAAWPAAEALVGTDDCPDPSAGTELSICQGVFFDE